MQVEKRDWWLKRESLTTFFYNFLLNWNWKLLNWLEWQTARPPMSFRTAFQLPPTLKKQRLLSWYSTDDLTNIWSFIKSNHYHRVILKITPTSANNEYTFINGNFSRLSLTYIITRQIKFILYCGNANSSYFYF